MKRRFWPILSLVLALACGALLFLWQGERAAPDVDDLWLRSMNGAYQRFSYYLGGNESEYWYGVAELHTMADCATALNMDGSRSADAAVDTMIYVPDLAKAHLREIEAILGTCISDPYNTTQWSESMNELYHLLEEEN
mgnify:CR=1 FL=1